MLQNSVSIKTQKNTQTKDHAIRNFAGVLVHNFYEKNPNLLSNGAALISDILMQIREAEEFDNSVEININHERAVFTNFSGAVRKSYTFKHDEFPQNADKEGVKKFVEKILSEVFYSQ